MEANELINKIEGFYDEYYSDKLAEIERLNKKKLIVDFKKIAKFNPEIAEQLLDNFEESVKAFELATKFEIMGFKVRIKNIPNSEYKHLWQIKVNDIGKLIKLRGYIRKVTDIIHSVSSARFECPSCGNIISILQLTPQFKSPNKCGCGRKGSFKLISKEMFDYQKIVLEEDPVNLKTPTQKLQRIVVELKYDLADTVLIQPSKKIEITGIVKEEQIKDTIYFKKYLDANYIKVIDDSIMKLEASPTEIAEFQKVEPFKELTQSVFPTIQGHEKIKQAVLLQLVGGDNIYRDNELEERGVIHILLVGSPGSGKTMFLRNAARFIPGSRFGGGKGSSAVGLMAAVIKDEDLGVYSIEAGMVPLANNALACIDEIDKMDKRNDLPMLNNAMNELKIGIDKASIHMTLETNTSILAAGNPKDRVFDKREPVWKQIDLPKDFMDRFDLVYPVEVMQKEEEQKKVAKVIFSKYNKDKLTEPIYSREFVTKYIAYAKKFKPIIPMEVEEYITNNFISLLRPSGSGEDAAYFSSRLITNIIRLTQASTKLRLTNEASIIDAQKAIELLVDSFVKQEIITMDGLIDIEKLENIVPKIKRDKAYSIKEIIKSHDTGEGTDIELIITKAVEKNILEQETEEILDKLKNSGDLFCPKPNKFKVI